MSGRQCDAGPAEKGAVTVGYVLIFPVVILCVVIIIQIGLLYYQQALFQSVVGESIQNWAMLWGYEASLVNAEKGITGKDSYVSEGLYWHIFSGADVKKNALEKDIKRLLLKSSIIKPKGEIKTEVEFTNYIIAQKIDIRAWVVYPSPCGKLLQFIGFPDEIVLEAHYEATVNDPKEFINNVDYLLQIYNETQVKDRVESLLEPLAQSLEKIKNYLK
ncbi:MAG: pilus assembly protein TadE [Clostridiaceae bacterium]|nr:pilus assembly protein TadE [Clostridiaceae bacterium]